MNEFQPLVDLLSPYLKWLPTGLAVMGAMRLLLKPFNAKLQSVLTETLAKSKSEPDEAAWWHDKILSRPWYRMIAFTADLIGSVKLPSHADFHALTNKTP